MSVWFFQMLFVATTASIVSGTILERTKLRTFWAFTLILTAFIYPIAGAWVWGGGWLDEMGFQDFAGSTVVHITGGCAALAALLVIGPRCGKFRPDGSVKVTPPSNVLVVTLGVLILWLGWFGFNGGSQLSLATPGDAVMMSSVLANTNLAASSGLITAAIFARPIFGRLSLASSLNGALAGLVSITAAPNIAESWWAVIIGAVGGLLCSLATRLLERLKLDDVVGAIPVHLVAGVWGTLAASIAGGADFGVQLLGVASVGGVHVHSLLHRLEGHRPHGSAHACPARSSMSAKTWESSASNHTPSSCSCQRTSTTTGFRLVLALGAGASGDGTTSPSHRRALATVVGSHPTRSRPASTVRPVQVLEVRVLPVRGRPVGTVRPPVRLDGPPPG